MKFLVWIDFDVCGLRMIFFPFFFLKQTLRNLLSKVSPSFSAELKQLSQQYEQLFHKWMLQLRYVLLLLLL